MSDLIVDQYLRPTRVHYYEAMSEVPMDEIASNQRTFLNLAAVNVEISSRSWDFSTDTLEGLFDQDENGFVDSTLRSVELCQQAYFDGSERLARYRVKDEASFPDLIQRA